MTDDLLLELTDKLKAKLDNGKNPYRSISSML